MTQDEGAGKLLEGKNKQDTNHGIGQAAFPTFCPSEGSGHSQLWGWGCRVQQAGCKVLDAGCRGAGCKDAGVQGCRVQDAGYRL